MMEIRPASTRGRADFGWLDSRHTFSFGSWYDPRYMGFGHLRVINDDRVEPGRGFGTHPHRDMEIISYVVDGELAHRDTLGTGSVIRPGEVQRMSAGSGILHSEMNPSPDQAVRFLQIWILPARAGTAPSYAQEDFGRDPGLRLVVSPDGREGSITVGQDMDLYRALLPDGLEVEVPRRLPRAWVQVVRGELTVDGAALREGDGLAITHGDSVRLVGQTDDAEALVFDLV